MAKNPMAFMQLASLWASFTKRHPKFPAFLKAASQAAMQEGSIVEIQVTTPDGKTLTSNLKVGKEDLEMIRTIQKMQK